MQSKKEESYSRKNFSKKATFFIKEFKEKGIDFYIQISKRLEIGGEYGQFSANL